MARPRLRSPMARPGQGMRLQNRCKSDGGKGATVADGMRGAAISGPLASVTSRSCTVTNEQPAAQGHAKAQTAQIPKLTAPFLCRLRRGLRLKDGPGSQEQPLSVFG
jgi:hypothetical protein